MAITKIRSLQQFEANSNISLNSAYKITDAINGTNPQDYVTLAQLNAVAQGIDPKESVRAATISNITLSGTQTIDGISLSVNDRVLVKAQTLGQNNGIYTVQSGAWTRATDADTSTKVTPGMYCFVEEGTIYADTGWILVTDSAVVLGTTVLNFTQFSGAGSYTAGSGLTLTGTSFSANTSGVTTGIASGNIVVRSTGTAGQIIVSNGTGGTEAAWGSLNLALSATVGSSILNVLNGGTGQSTYTDGQLLIGNTSGGLTKTTLTQGTNIVITNGNGTITIATATTVLATTSIVTREVPTGSINSSNVTFTLAYTPVVGTESVFLNGVLQNIGVGNDYTISGVTITFETPATPQTGDVLIVSYIK